MCDSSGEGNKLLLNWETLGAAAKGPDRTGVIFGHGTNIAGSTKHSQPAHYNSHLRNWKDCRAPTNHLFMPITYKAHCANQCVAQG